ADQPETDAAQRKERLEGTVRAVSQNTAAGQHRREPHLVRAGRREDEEHQAEERDGDERERDAPELVLLTDDVERRELQHATEAHPREEEAGDERRTREPDPGLLVHAAKIRPRVTKVPRRPQWSSAPGALRSRKGPARWTFPGSGRPMICSATF